MFTDAKENLRIVSYFRGNGRVLRTAESGEAVSTRPAEVDGTAGCDHGVKCCGSRRSPVGRFDGLPRLQFRVRRLNRSL
jgi:hypothetical protein